MTGPIRRRRPIAADTPADTTPETPKPEAAKPIRRRAVIPIATAPVQPPRGAPAHSTPDALSQEDAASKEEMQQDKVIVQRYMDRIRNPTTAIRARCVQCCNGQPKEVQLCPATGCALHPFRMGKNPFHKRTGSTRPGTTKEDDNED